jgi:hypothetical protein
MSENAPSLADKAARFHANRATQHVEIADNGKMRVQGFSSSCTETWREQHGRLAGRRESRLTLT